MLAVGLFSGWRPALLGTGLAAGVLAVIVVVLGAAIDSFPVADAQVVVGVFLLLFGLRWLHKAILRQAGLKAQHDEAEEFEATQRALSSREHWVALTTAFNGVLLEGVEVVLIVIALGGVGHRVGAVVGAVAALAAVVVLGVVLRAPLTKVPENLMKATVGVMLTSFGVFFVGEGIGVDWWHDDASLRAARRDLRDRSSSSARACSFIRAGCRCHGPFAPWRPRSGACSSARARSRWRRWRRCSLPRCSPRGSMTPPAGRRSCSSRASCSRWS